ncbi:MAG: hypothetical protein ACXAEU_24370 [Candidatus Hodarchaeales archaeon]|jgi:replication factor A1
MDSVVNLREMIKYIALKSGKNGKEIRHLIKRKKKQLKNLITDEAAVKLIARDLDLEIKLVEDEEIEKTDSKITSRFNNQVPLSSLEEKMKNEKFIEAILGVYSRSREREFTRQHDGSRGSVSWINIFDITNVIFRLVFWDDRSKEIEYYRNGDKIFVEGARIRESYHNRQDTVELHVTNLTKITIIGEVPIPEELKFNTGEPAKIKLHQIEAGHYNIETSGEIVSLGPLKEFFRKNGTKGRVCKTIIRDSGSYIPLVLWDDQTDVLEQIQEGSIIRVHNARSKRTNDRTELHVGTTGEIEIVA